MFLGLLCGTRDRQEQPQLEKVKKKKRGRKKCQEREYDKFVKSVGEPFFVTCPKPKCQRKNFTRYVNCVVFKTELPDKGSSDTLTVFWDMRANGSRDADPINIIGLVKMSHRHNKVINSFLEEYSPMSQSTMAQVKISLSEYSGPNLSPRVLWLRSKYLSKSTLEQTQIPLSEYSGKMYSGTDSNLFPRVLWQEVLSLSQDTLGEGYRGLSTNFRSGPGLVQFRSKSLSQSPLAQTKDFVTEHSCLG